jgi:RHS repeat-associated protein
MRILSNAKARKGVFPNSRRRKGVRRSKGRRAYLEPVEGAGLRRALHWRNTGGDSQGRAFVPFQGRLPQEYYCGEMTLDHPDEIGSLAIAKCRRGGAFGLGSFARHSSLATRHCSHERLFFPFGEFWQGSDFYSLNPHQTFAQLPDYDNDASTDLYNTLNRHYTPMGRWLSPDPGGVNAVHLDDPQTWNMYAYVRNNPTTLVDPLGLQQVVVECSTNMKTCVGVQDKPQPPTDKPTTAQNQTQTETQYSETVIPNSTQVTITQTKTETTTTTDASGNVVSKDVKTTITTAMYDISGSSPKMLWATQGSTPLEVTRIKDENYVLQAFGGASRVYDTLASVIRNDGRVAYGTKVLSGALAGTEIAGAYTAGNIGRIAWAAVRERLIDAIIDRFLRRQITTGAGMNETDSGSQRGGRAKTKPSALQGGLAILASMSVYAYLSLSTNRAVLPTAIVLLCVLELVLFVRSYRKSSKVEAWTDLASVVVLLLVCLGVYRRFIVGHATFIFATVFYRPFFTRCCNPRLALALNLMIVAAVLPGTCGIVTNSDFVGLLGVLYALLVGCLWVFCSKLGASLFGFARGG